MYEHSLNELTLETRQNLVRLCKQFGVTGYEWMEEEQQKEEAMGVADSLMAAGFKPKANEDQVFETLVGHYRCSLGVLRSEKAKDGRDARWAAQWFIEEVLEGTHVDTNLLPEKRRRFFRSYQKTEEGLTKLLNDLFTMGVTLDTQNDDTLEGSFVATIGKEAFIRSWSWTPDQTIGGTAIPEHERKPRQMFVVKKQADIRLGKQTATASTPF